MAKRLAQRIGRRKRSHQVGARLRRSFQSIMRLPKSSLNKRSCFENSSAVNRVRMIHCFSTQASPFPNFLAMSPLMKYGNVCCRLRGDSGIDPAIVYAMNKTGRMVTEANLEFLSDWELQEWNDAVNEFRQKIKAGEIQ
jgi:hypothetical protein